MTDLFTSFAASQDKKKPDISLLNLCEWIITHKEDLSAIKEKESNPEEIVTTTAKKFPVVLNKKELYHHVFPKFSKKEYISYLQEMNDSYKNLPIPNFEPTKTLSDSFSSGNYFYFNKHQIIEYIEKRKNNESKDRFNISMNLIYKTMVKYSKFIDFLEESFNNILLLPKKYTLHNEWCLANIYTRYKGGDENDPSRFRPLTCLPLIVRIFEGVLSKKIHDICLMFNIIDKDVQKAVVKNCSGLWENRFEVNILLNRAKKSNKNDIFAFIDFSNAFGTVNYKNLTFILKKYNFPDIFVEYIVKFYANIHGIYKDSKFKWTNGLIQGSSLSNILFLIYIDFFSKNLISEMKMMKYIPNNYSTKNNLFAFVDDFLITLPNDEKNSERFMFINLFTRINGLSINFDKSNFITFNNDLEEISFENKKLLKTPNNFKYLGMNLITHCEDYFQELSISLNNILCQIDSMNIDKNTKLYVFYQNILTRILPHLEIYFAIEGFNSNFYNIFFLLKYFFARWSIDVEYDISKQICNHMLLKMHNKIAKSESLSCYKNLFPTNLFNISEQDQELYNVSSDLKEKSGEGYFFLFQKEIPCKEMVTCDFEQVKQSKSFPKINFDKIQSTFYGNNFVEFIT